MGSSTSIYYSTSIYILVLYSQYKPCTAMGQLYYAQTQLYSTVLGVKFSGQYGLSIAIHYSLRGVHLVLGYSAQILSQGPNQLIYTRGWRGYYARRRCTASLRSVVHHVRAGQAEYPGGAGLQADRILGLFGGACEEAPVAGYLWVPICLGDHVWRVGVLRWRLG